MKGFSLESNSSPASHAREPGHMEDHDPVESQESSEQVRLASFFEQKRNETMAAVEAALREYDHMGKAVLSVNMDSGTTAKIEESLNNIQNAGKKFGRFVLTRILPALMLYYGSASFVDRKSGPLSEKAVAKIELAQNGIAPLEDDGGERSEATRVYSALDLKAVADKALKNQANLRNCNMFTAYVASVFGYHELAGKVANEQIAYMQKHWNRVEAEVAQEIANDGGLVIAGLVEAGHGHTTVVVPGKGETKSDDFFPNVEGGAMSPVARSDGSKTAAAVFKRLNRVSVEYFTPETIK